METSREAYPPAAPYEGLSGRSPEALTALRRGLRALRDTALRHPRLCAFAGYLVLGIVTVGWYPISDPTSVCACSSNTDPPTYMWALEWWPYAIVHGLNPFVSHVIWAPVGGNLARSATIPTAALLMWPATAAFGPVASYNLMMLLSAVLSAFTAYLLCRRIVGRELPAVAGGLLFGFGPFEFAQLIAHPNISLLFLLPLFVLVALRRLDGEISRRAYIAWMAVLLVAQMGLSTEILATAIVIAAVVLIAARFISPVPYRARIGRLVGETCAAGVIALIVASPFIYYALIKGGSPQEWPLADAYGLDLLNPLFPTEANWLGAGTFATLSQTFENNNVVEAGGYLSLPIVIAFVLWAAKTKRRALARILLVAIAASVLLALGAHLHVAGKQTLELPFNWVKNWPVFRLVTPGRIFVYVALAVAIGVAAWLAEGRALPKWRMLARWVVFGLGALFIFPNIASGLWAGSPSNPRFFRAGTYRHYLRRGETVLALPYGWGGDSMLWQAETGFYFRMPEGYLGHFGPQQFESEHVVGELLFEENKGVNATGLQNFLRKRHVAAIVVDEKAVAPNLPLVLELGRIGLKPTRVGGVLFYPVPQVGA